MLKITRQGPPLTNSGHHPWPGAWLSPSPPSQATPSTPHCSIHREFPAALPMPGPFRASVAWPVFFPLCRGCPAGSDPLTRAPFSAPEGVTSLRSPVPSLICSSKRGWVPLRSPFLGFLYTPAQPLSNATRALISLLPLEHELLEDRDETLPCLCFW